MLLASILRNSSARIIMFKSKIYRFQFYSFYHITCVFYIFLFFHYFNYSKSSKLKFVSSNFIKSKLKKYSQEIYYISKNPKMLLKVSFYTFAHSSKFCIIGGGTAGVNVAAHLLRSKINPRDITIFEPSRYHYYQAGWTMVGGGQVRAEDTREQMDKMIPDKVHTVKESVTKVQPQKNLIITDKNHQYSYDHLIIAAGFKLDWDKIKGAKQFLQNPNSKVCSIYDYRYTEKTANIGNKYKGGKAIFTQPIPPIKCAGAPQKILYLWTDKWLKQLKGNVKVQFIKAAPVMFSVLKYSRALQNVANSYQVIKVSYNHNLIEITNDKAIFENLGTKQRVQKQYDFLHVVPPMSPPSFIKESGISDQAGFVDVDKFTLRHTKHANIWSLGDCSSLPTSRTGAAVFSQTQVLIKNILAVLKNPEIKTLPESYDGYASCPLFVGRGEVMLAQFLYDGKISQSFLKDQQKPRKAFYYLTKYCFPLAYWKLMPRGLWKGKDGIRWY